MNYAIIFSFVYVKMHLERFSYTKFPGRGVTEIPELRRPTGECHPITVVLDPWSYPGLRRADVLELHVSAVYGIASQNCSAL